MKVTLDLNTCPREFVIPKLLILIDGPFETFIFELTKVNYVNASKPGFSAEVE